MAEPYEQVAQLDEQLLSLESNFAESAKVAQAFQSELISVSRSFSDAQKYSSDFSRSLDTSLKSSIHGLIFEGDKLSDVMSGLAESMISRSFSQSVSPVTNAVSGALSTGITSMIGGVLGFANGGAFSQGRVTPFAKGGVVSSPTSFPMRGGTGLMGEAGAEAIMPLTRGADGSLGVRASGGVQSSVTVNMNISTPDAESFTRSRSQVAAKLGQALQQGQRNL
jgi:lambda family phage tail tape measure protein